MTFHSHAPDAPRPDREIVPKRLLRAMFALVLAVLALVTYARLTDMPVVATPPDGAITAERTLYLAIRDLSGAVMVLDETGSLVGDLSPEEGGFIAGVARVIEHERKRAGVTQDGPVRIMRRDTGRLSIADPSTGWSADLMGFGADNARAFARLLDQ